ncbi:MAG: phosphoglycerate dehydrogenase [Cyclobacteriaceae bacterium]
MHESIVPLLEEQGFEVLYKPMYDRQTIIERLQDCTGLIIRSKNTVDAELLQKADKLKFVARAGAGIDLLDVEELERRSIQIVNAPEGNRDALGEHALGMLLSLSNKINLADQSVRKGIWDREGHRGFEIKGKTVGVIGYGFMGSAFSEKLSGLHCKVLAYDNDKTGYSSTFVQESTMEQIYEQTDILSFHVPLTKETRAMADESFFQRFRKDLIVLNTSRGEVLRLDHLLKCLKNGKVKAAGLDVLENEKLQTLSPSEKATFDELTKSEKVLLTPHVGGWTVESYRKINEVLVQKIAQLEF